MLIDTHAHLNFPDYENDLGEVVEKAKKAGVTKIICASSNLEDSQKAVDLSQKYPKIIYASIGIHPQQTDPKNKLTITEQLTALKKLATSRGVVAIGECGLDYSPAPPPEKDRARDDQITLFKGQIEIALTHHLPLIIHTRESFSDTISILSEYKATGTIHCYTGGKKGIQKVLDLGFYFGLDGNLTYDEGVQNVTNLIPLEKILLETDSPFLSPVPHRGQRNEPAYTKLIAEKLAQIKSMELESLENQLFKNTLQLFELK